MPNLPLDPKSRGRILRLAASSLLAGTSIAALLLAVPAKAGQNNGTVSGGIANTGTINVVSGGLATGISVRNSTVSGGITNSGTISASGITGIGIRIENNSIVPGGIVNRDTINAGIGIRIENNSTVSGGIVNRDTINAATAGISVGDSTVIGSLAGGITNSGTINAGHFGFFIVDGNNISGGIVNSGAINVITNSGTITASGKTGIGVALAGGATVSGGITNTGTIMGSTAAIDVSGEGGPTTIMQSAGALIGSVLGSGNAKGDVLNFTGGRIVLSPTQSISGLGTYTQTGGTLVLGVTPSTVAGTFASLSAGTINLRGGTLQLTPQGSLFGFAATQTYRNIIAADPPLSGSFASVITTNPFFTASVSPDAVTPNALDATLALNFAAIAASAQDLTQDSRLGLDAPRVLTQAIQDRLVANGGALGEWVPSGPAPAISKGPVSQPTFSFGNANIWARGADQFGSATAPASGAGVGYDINRAAPLIAGVDWRLDNGIVAGVAATYVATSAKFKDGSSTNVSSYQGGAYAGWAGGPWYALGSVVVSFNEFGTSRLLTPFGLPGDATSSPSGQSYQGHAEAGYHCGVPAAGVNVSVTPYAALDYVNAHLQGFSETGGFGALSVNATDANSFQTTLGVRLTSRIAMGTYGTIIPELRLGWNHEFLDASQKITASLVGVSGSSFSATGIASGRDAALVGAGFSMELSPDAKVFVDYDGRLGSRVQEHSISGGLKLRF